MAARRVRVEFIRFGLLLVMTVALISVAARYNDHSSGRDQAARSHRSGSTASPSTASPSTGGSAGSAQTPATQSPTTPRRHPAAGGRSGGTGQTAAVATLPRTGGTQAVELAAVAGLFIAAGTLTVRISRVPGGRRQLATSAQAAQALGSSESNRPGTS